MLLHVALFMQIVLTDPQSVELETRRRELGLLHSAIERTILRTLSVWDAQTNLLREVRPGESADDSSPVVILHLWATWCAPCKEEFPIWATIGQHLAARHKGKVRIVYVALQNDSSDMAAFVRQLPDKLPFAVKYFDRSELLLTRLRQAFDDNQPNLPLTLVLDSERIVRQAFLGPIQNRRQELVDATARLMRLTSEHPDPARPPLAAGTPSRPKAPPATEATDTGKWIDPRQQYDAAKRLRRSELAGPQGWLDQKEESVPDQPPLPSDDLTAVEITQKPPAKRPPSRFRRPLWRVVLGGLTAGAGLVLAGFGTSALAAQGSCIPDPMMAMPSCDYVYSTNVIGGSFIGIGSALTVEGIVLLAVPGR